MKLDSPPTVQTIRVDGLKQRIGSWWRDWRDWHAEIERRIQRRRLHRAMRKSAYEIIAVGQNNGECQIHLNAAKDELYRASAALDGGPNK